MTIDAEEAFDRATPRLNDFEKFSLVVFLPDHPIFPETLIFDLSLEFVLDHFLHQLIRIEAGIRGRSAVRRGTSNASIETGKTKGSDEGQADP